MLVLCLDISREDYEVYLTKQMDDLKSEGQRSPPVILVLTQVDKRSRYFAKVSIPKVELIEEKAKALGFMGVVETSAYYPYDGNVKRAFERIFEATYAYGRGHRVEFFVLPFDKYNIDRPDDGSAIEESPVLYRKVSCVNDWSNPRVLEASWTIDFKGQLLDIYVAKNNIA